MITQIPLTSVRICLLIMSGKVSGVSVSVSLLADAVASLCAQMGYAFMSATTHPTYGSIKRAIQGYVDTVTVRDDDTVVVRRSEAISVRSERPRSQSLGIT